MATFGVCSSLPPTPPTASAAEESEPFFKGLKKVRGSNKSAHALLNLFNKLSNSGKM